MEKRIEQALNNLNIIVAETKMTRQEHAQLVEDLNLVTEACGDGSYDKKAAEPKVVDRGKKQKRGKIE